MPGSEFSVNYILEDLYPGCLPININRIQMFHKGISKYLEGESYEIFKNVSEIQAQGNRLPLHIFTTFPNLKSISLIRNNIEHFKKSIYTFPSLSILDLSGNKINPNDLPKLGFIKTLKELVLSRNEISYLPTEFSSEGNFPSLEILRLDQNSLRFQNIFFILSKLPKLVTLNLDNNGFQEVPYLVAMKGNQEYEELLKNSLRLLESYGHFLQKHHLRYLNRKLYHREIRISSCSFTNLETQGLLNGKNAWRIEKQRLKFNKEMNKKQLSTSKRFTRECKLKIQKRDSQVNINSSDNFKNNFQIFDQYMAKKVKLNKTVSFSNFRKDDLMNSKDSEVVLEKEDITIPKNDQKFERDFLFNKTIDSKVDRSIYELDYVPFPRLENISLQKCEFNRQVTILSAVIWPSILQFNLIGNRLFDQSSHPGNVKAIIKFFKKAGITILTGYHFSSYISEEKMLNKYNSSGTLESRSFDLQRNKALHHFWRNMSHHNKSKKYDEYGSLWDTDSFYGSYSKGENTGTIDLQLGQRPPIL